MRRPRRTATFLLAGGLVLGSPALAACGEDEPATNEQVENDIEDLDDEGAVPGVGEDEGPGADEQVENDIEDLDDEGAVPGVTESPSG